MLSAIVQGHNSIFCGTMASYQITVQKCSLAVLWMSKVIKSVDPKGLSWSGWGRNANSDRKI